MYKTIKMAGHQFFNFLSSYKNSIRHNILSRAKLCRVKNGIVRSTKRRYDEKMLDDSTQHQNTRVNVSKI